MIILSIEDDKSCRDLIKLHLLKFKNVFYNLEIHEASSLTEGLKSAETFEPDMILLDGDLPDSIMKDTIEVVPKLSKNAAVIMLTNYENVDMVISAMKNGAQDYINKKLLVDGKEFIKTLTTAWSRFEGKKIKETHVLASPRIKRVTQELIEMARQDMTIDELKDLIEFSNYARSNFEDFQKKINKMYSAIYETNGTPSIKEQLSHLRESLDKLLRQNEYDEERREEEKKEIKVAHITGKWQFWAVIAPIFATGLIAGISYIFEWIKLLFPHN